MDITRDVMRLMTEGKSASEIRTYIDATYSKYGPPTDTEPIPIRNLSQYLVSLQCCLCYNTVGYLEGVTMLLRYIQAALDRAHYEMIVGEEPFYGEVPALEGVWATGRTLEECRATSMAGLIPTRSRILTAGIFSDFSKA